MAEVNAASAEDTSFKRKLSKREKKQLKKQEKLNKMKAAENGGNGHEAGNEGVAEKLYTGRRKNSCSVELLHSIL